MDEWEKAYKRTPEVGEHKTPKNMPRWLRPRTRGGLAASYILNPYSLAMNVGTSLFMAYTMPAVGRELKKYANGDPRAFNEWLDKYLKKQKKLQESIYRFFEAETEDNQNDDLVAKDGDLAVPQAPGAMIADKIIESMSDLSEEEQLKVIALFKALGEANIKSLAEDNKLLPTVGEGYPLLPIKDQKALGLSDDELERLTPIAMLLATLGGLHASELMLGKLPDQNKE